MTKAVELVSLEIFYLTATAALPPRSRRSVILYEVLQNYLITTAAANALVCVGLNCLLKISSCFYVRIQFLKTNKIVLGPSLPSNPAARVRFPAGIRNFNSYPGTGCVSLLPYVISVSGPDIVLTAHLGRHAHFYLSSVLVQVCCSPQWHLNHGHLGCKSGGVSPTLGRVTNRGRGRKTELEMGS